MRKPLSTTKTIAGAVWLVVFVVVGMAANRLEASCGDYLTHKHHPTNLLGKEKGPFAPHTGSQPTGKCQGGSCDRSRMPLPVDPLSPRVTVREIATAGVPRFEAFDLDQDDWMEIASSIPDTVFLSGPLKPPIL